MNKKLLIGLLAVIAVLLVTSGYLFAKLSNQPAEVVYTSQQPVQPAISVPDEPVEEAVQSEPLPPVHQVQDTQSYDDLNVPNLNDEPAYRTLMQGTLANGDKVVVTGQVIKIDKEDDLTVVLILTQPQRPQIYHKFLINEAFIGRPIAVIAKDKDIDTAILDDDVITVKGQFDHIATYNNQNVPVIWIDHYAVGNSDKIALVEFFAKRDELLLPVQIEKLRKKYGVQE